jgi:hypothetical protein
MSPRWATAHGPPRHHGHELPTADPEDRRLLLLVSLQTSPRQVVPGRLVGMGQSTAPQWMHVLLGALQATRRALGETPTRSVTELAKRLGVAAANGAAGACHRPRRIRLGQRQHSPPPLWTRGDRTAPRAPPGAD